MNITVTNQEKCKKQLRIEIPSDVAEQLPKAGKARVIVLTGENGDEAERRAAAYEQFLRDDSTEDAVYYSE